MEADINRYFEKSTRYGRAKSLYKQYRSYDVSHGYDGDETVKTEWILKNILGEGCKCYYCGSMAWRYLGVDRDDSRKGHTEENSVCCCEECNRGKGEYTKEEFKKISEIKIYISKTIKTMETYELTRMEDYVEINNRYNREADPDSQKIKEIMNRMRKDLRDGVFTIDRCIQVEPNLHECMSGGHRLTAGRKLATTDGLIYPLVVVPVDLGGDVERVKKYIEEADLAIINQEVPCAGEGTAVAGYPAFNAPHEALDVMAELGFDVFTTATNHCLDKGYAGLVNTLDYLHENYPFVLTTGTYSSYEDSSKTPVIEVNGVKIAVLDYTYGTNGVTVKYDYSVNLLGNLDKLSEDITRAKQEADFVIVCCHWGREYYTGVISEQREYAQTIADLGADLIIGTHPHVVEPMEYIETEDGRSVPVYYSLGNFIAFQNVFPRPIGGLACITLRVDGSGVSIEKADLDFTFVSAVNYAADKYDFKVFKVSDLMPALVNAYCFGSSRFSYSDIVDFCKKMTPDWSL